MAKNTETPAIEGVGDDLEALLLGAADRLNEPGPALINTLKPVHWPDVAQEEIERLARGSVSRGTAPAIEVARRRAQLVVGRQYAQRFAAQSYVRVMCTPVAQPRAPVPDAGQSDAMAKLAITFANGDETMLAALAEEAYNYYRLAGVAELLVMRYGAKAYELVQHAEEAGDAALAARVRTKLETYGPLLGMDAAYEEVRRGQTN